MEWDGEDSFSQVAKKSLVEATNHDHVAVKVGMKQVYTIVLTKGEVLTFADQSCGDRNLTTVFSGV